MLFLYSDGVTETTGVDGSEYGDRLQTLLLSIPSRSPREIIAAVLDDLRKFSIDSQLADDRSLLALKFGEGTY
jgi:serine phosphatase RsbU (regulator of sigma subunit)